MRGHIAQRESKRGGYLYYVVLTVDGRQKWYKPPGDATKRNAEAYLTQVLCQVNGSALSTPREILFSDFAEIFMEKSVRQLAPLTRICYGSMLGRSILPFFGPRKLSQISTEDVQTFKASLMARVSPQTVVNTMTLLRVLLHRAIDWDYLRTSPAKKVSHPRVPRPERGFLSPLQVRQLIEHAPNEKWRAFFLVAVVGGLRIGELLAMKWVNVDWKGGRYHVKENLLYASAVGRLTLSRTKTDYSENPVDLAASCIEALRKHQLEQEREKKDAGYMDQGLIFADQHGGPIRRNYVASQVFQPTLKRAGLPKIRLHDLRHTCASLLINQGESPKYVQRQMRHTSIQITFDRYGHLLESTSHEATRRLDQTLFGQADNSP